MSAQPFPHNFKKGNINDLNRAMGYSQALMDVYKHIEIVSNGGTNSFISALPLIERISATNDELIQFTEEVAEELEEQLRKEMSISTEQIKDDLT